jgi:hypothetical protein
MDVDVEVVDAPLGYNLLLGCNWTYSMTAVVSFIFCTLCFPHEGKIITIDQLSFAHASPNASVGTGADPGFNASTTHQQNPNYRPFRQHLRSR